MNYKLIINVQAAKRSICSTENSILQYLLMMVKSTLYKIEENKGHVNKN